jgi:hypothetical protein
MRWHYCLGHASFATLKKDGSKWQNTKAICQSPAAQVHGLPLWRNAKNTLARQRVESLSRGLRRHQAGGVRFGQPNGLNASGFYAQMTGKLTTRRYHGATIFVDHFSRLRFIHLMQVSSSNETIKAKRAFEQFAADHGVKLHTTIATTADLRTTHSNRHARAHNKDSPFAA